MSPASSAPIAPLYIYQLGSEVTWGTPVTPTAQLGLISDLQFSPEIEAMNIKERRGSGAPGYVAALLKQTGTAKLSGTMSYEDAPYWLDGLIGQASPSGGGPYLRNYLGFLGTMPARRVFTLVKGQTTPVAHCYGLSGAVVSQAVFKIESGQPFTYELDFIGKAIATSSFGSLSDRTQSPILAPQFSLYIDSWGGTIGSTQITTTWYSAELTINTNADVHYGIGNLNPANWHEGPEGWEASLKMTLEFDATSKAMLDSILGSSLLQKQIRIKATTGASAICQFDIAGSFLKAPEITKDKDGVVTLEFEMDGLYNSALGNYIKASSTNGVAVLA